ncbi:hypothetical protein Gohar_025970 [Gossypium harknessii]|uniref:ADP/ATP translocase n=1 Tax=Gossypium harknessii TaxID=34285 RepID=A0A7J9HQ31_9ROSI|nr:hypothetical protein [Gossypium harknessii]
MTFSYNSLLSFPFLVFFFCFIFGFAFFDAEVPTKSRKDIEWTRVQTIGLGFVSFAAPQLLFYPFLYAGTRLSTDVKKTISYTGGNRQFNGVIDVFGKTLKLDGIAGLYRGLIISVAETGIKAAAVYVGLFPHYLHVSQNNILSRPMLEYGVVICYEMAGYPLNTVSRRMMLTSGTVKYKGTLHAIAHILTTEGEKSFYSGAGAQILGCVVYAGTEVLTEGSSLTITW